MPVSDQWKAREKAVGGRLEMNSKTREDEVKSRPTEQANEQTDSTAEGGAGPLSSGRTKGLAGFWANQNDEVKVSRKKRLEAVETPTTETVVENVPQRLDGVVRAEDPGEWKKPVEMEAGRTRNVASAFQQQQKTPVSQTAKRAGDVVTQTPRRGDVAPDNVDVVRRTKPPVLDTAPANKPAQSSDVVLNRSSATVVLAENDPEQLSPDVVRSSGGSSWDDVTELEAGRTRNLLQHWKSTEEDAAQPKTSTTRYQAGAKPAWILEIEEARATSSGAIGQSEAWSGHQRQQHHQLQQLEQQEKREEKIANEKDVAEETAPEEATISKDVALQADQMASQATDATVPLGLSHQVNDESVTSQQQPDSDVTSPLSHSAQELCDVSITSLSQQDNEPVTVARDLQYKTPSVSVSSDQPATPNVDVDDAMTSRTTDVTESAPAAAAEDFEICAKSEVASDDVITHQQPTPSDQDTRSAMSATSYHEQQLPATTATTTVARQQNTTTTTVDFEICEKSEAASDDVITHPQPIPADQDTRSAMSVTSHHEQQLTASTATATAARQQNTTSTTVDPADHGRGKRRHKDDKSKINEQSSERRCSLM